MKYIAFLFMCFLTFWFYSINPSSLVTTLIIYASFSFLIWLILEKVKHSHSVKIFAVSFFLILCVFEVIIRLSLPHLKTYPERIGYGYVSMYEPRNKTWYFKHSPYYVQNRVQPEFTHLYKANSLGIFAKEPEDIDHNKYKILCLGDSFTEGVGAEQHESWPAYLQQKLNATYPDSFEVINAGIGGSDVFYMWKLYEDILKVYQPNQIIMFIGNSDLEDIFVRGGDTRFMKDSTVHYKEPPLLEYVFASSYIVRLMVFSFSDFNFFLVSNESYLKGLEESCKLISKKLKKIKRELKKDSIVFTPIIHPVPFEMERKKFNFECFATLANDKKINSIDLIKVAKKNKFKIPKDFRPYYWPTDGHYNAKGYEMIADLIFISMFKN